MKIDVLSKLTIQYVSCYLLVLFTQRYVLLSLYYIL